MQLIHGVFSVAAVNTRVFLLTALMTVHSRGAALVFSGAGPTSFHLPVA